MTSINLLLANEIEDSLPKNVFICGLRVLASAFDHPMEISTQVQLASACDYLPVRLTWAGTDSQIFGSKKTKEEKTKIRQPVIYVPVLVFQQFIVDLLDVNLLPQNVVVTVDIIDDRVVQVVQFLKQAQFFPDSL